jgi:uncharacterized protein YbjT (DUF2867 family)
MKEKVLITSATGKTGFATAAKLLEEGVPVRIYVRSKNAKALQLESIGAEIALGELDNYTQLESALNGVKYVYYCHPFIPNLLSNVSVFIKAAKAAEIAGVVFMGQWLAEFEEQKSITTRDTRAAYNEFEQSGLNVVYFVPGYFAENTFVVVLELAVQLGIMPSPFADGKNPIVSNEDLAAVLAKLLQHPEPYFGKRLRPTGPKSLSMTEMAAVISKITGRKVRVLNIPDWLFIKAAFSIGKEFGIDQFQISQARLYNLLYRQNKFDVGGPTNVVKLVTGKEPEDFETIVKRYILGSRYGKPTISGWFAAMKKFMMMPLTPTPSRRELELLNQ